MSPEQGLTLEHARRLLTPQRPPARVWSGKPGKGGGGGNADSSMLDHKRVQTALTFSVRHNDPRRLHRRRATIRAVKAWGVNAGAVAQVLPGRTVGCCRKTALKPAVIYTYLEAGQRLWRSAGRLSCVALSAVSGAQLAGDPHAALHKASAEAGKKVKRSHLLNTQGQSGETGSERRARSREGKRLCCRAGGARQLVL
ncbi:hypothetical protein AAFF_G00034260 [Aldrovandia affinis]|uniref:Uncharacterized protein n=1 Tax=Aldrovandia affinis TaxID=143900 RepID=A0AAD7S3E1_9TELE|nr:hypothetical protein AAFF_G00034260 [Aldrovandia affinis]